MALIAAGAAAAGAAGWRALTRAERLQIAAIRFTGLRHTGEEELLALSPVKLRDHLLFADVDLVERALLRHPWVKRVEVRRRFPPAALDVRVRERVAVAIVDLSGLYLVDEDGDVFKRAAAGDGLDLPLVTGIARSEYLQRRAVVEPVLLRALALARAWRDERREGLARLSEIHADGDGFTLYVGEEGTEVRLGAGPRPARLARLEKVLSALRAEGKKAEVVHLDNRLHPSWVTVRLAADGRMQGQGVAVR